MSEKLALDGGEPVRDTQAHPWPTVGNDSGRDLGQEEIELLTEVIHSGTLFRYGGTMVEKFEQEYADFVGVSHCLAVTSGTAALHTAVGALQLEVGDEIITTTITDMGTVIAILAQNHLPVFADVDRRTLIMDPAKIEAAITARTRAIIVVHLFGQPAPMDEVLPIAQEHNLYVIEDCAQSHGAKWDGRMVGTMGHINCFSLQQSKQITTGDGGMVVTGDDELAARARMFHDKFYDRTRERRDVARLGMNYRMNELTGAVALAQTRKLSSLLARRRNSAELLCDKLRQIQGIIPPYVHPQATHSWWIFSFQLDEELLDCTVEQFQEALAAEGMPFGTGYAGGKPICMYPALAEHHAYGSAGFPWQPPYGRDIEYRLEDYPETIWAQENTFVTSWNEGFTEADVEDLGRGIAKVAAHYRGH